VREAEPGQQPDDARERANRNAKPTRGPPSAGQGAARLRALFAAEGEWLASTQLAKAADVISTNPTTLQLRYLQTLAKIATEQNSTIIFPVPIDIFKAMMRKCDE
jgi:hypothetical protein